MRTGNQLAGRRWDLLFRAIPLAIALCGLISTIFLADVLTQREMAQVQERTHAEAKHVAAQLRTGVLEAFDPLRRIAAWWLLEGRPLAPEDWDTDAQLFVSARAGLQMLAWLGPNGTQSWTARPGEAPDATPPAAPDSGLAETLAEARRLNALALSPVFQAGGKLLLYACSPVRRGARVIGYIAGLYDAAGLIRSVLAGQLPEDYGVLVTANEHTIRVANRQEPWPTGGEAARLALPAAVSWSVQVLPSGSSVTYLRRLVISFGVLVSVLLYVCASMARLSRQRSVALARANTRLVFENEERCRAEERIERLNRDLQRRLEEFQILLEVLPVGIAVAADAECRQVWINRSLAEMLQVPEGQTMAGSGDLPYKVLRSGAELAAGEQPMQVSARTRSALANQALDIVRADGSTIHTLCSCAPLYDEHGDVRGVIHACVDVTELKSLEQRVQRAEKYGSLALMAGGIAHDFNNLLTVIIGHASFLEAGLPRHSAAAAEAGELLAAARHATELVSQLLAFTGRIWCNAAPVNLSDVVAAMQKSLGERPPAGVEIRYDLAKDLPQIEAGLPELQQVIQNLIANAAEAMSQEQPGRIEVRTSSCTLSAGDLEIFYPDQQLTPGRFVRLEVSDSGCGIPDEIAGRVFDPFFTTKFVGRGLGLSAVQGIVRAHGGAVRLESSLHHGTRVEAIFPVSTGAGASAEDRPEPEKKFI